MVTDLHSNYSSPAGKEFTLTAGYFAGINPASRILDLGCGYGDGSCNMAQQFRCKVIALDISEENIGLARQLAEAKNVSHLITFETKNLLEADFIDEPFELVLAKVGFSRLFREAKALKGRHRGCFHGMARFFGPYFPFG